MSRAKAAFWGSISAQASTILTMLLTIVTTPLVLKFLNKEEYGLSTVLFQIVSYLAMFDFGLRSAVGRFLAMSRGKNEETKESINTIISTGFFSFSVIGLIIVVIGFLGSPYVPRLFKMNSNLDDVAIVISMTLSVLVGIQFPLRVFGSIFYAQQKQMLSNTTGFVTGILNLLLPVIFLYYGHHLWSFVYSNIICTVISLLITYVLLRKYYPFVKVSFSLFNKALLKQMFGFGFFMFINSIAVQVVFYTDRLLIGSLVSLSVVTMYSITARVSEICRTLIFKITDNAFPAMVEISTKEGTSKFKKVHQKLLIITMSCVSVAFWLILILNYNFIKLWVGESFFAGYPVLIITLALMLQHSVLHVSAVCLNGAGIVKGFSVVSIFEAAINLALSIYLGRRYGIEGVLLATVIAGSLTSVWYVIYTAIRYMNISAYEYIIKSLVIPLVAVSAVGILFYWLNQFVFTMIALNWISFLVIAFILVLVFSVFVWELFIKKEVVEYIPNRFKKYLFLA